MPIHLAEAGATKQFFLEMFTRDISLEDCILDLIDNSIDSLIRWRNIDVSDAILKQPKQSIENHLPIIDVKISQSEFEISDNCGGITQQDALSEVFRFGHLNPIKGSQLGVYGVGLKRALFKIGNNIEVISRTANEGFKANLEVDKWAKDRDNWKIPLTFVSGAGSLERAGTKISIQFLRPEIKLRIRSGTLEAAVEKSIAQTYSLFLERYVRVRLNGHAVTPRQIPVGESRDVKPAKETLVTDVEDGKVKATVIASLAARDRDNKWTAAAAGWYVLCNARVVLSADRSDLTGWGVGMPAFHSKYSGFVGVVFFYSPDPHLLPWTTTKRNLNRESMVFQKTRNLMIAAARPVISFLNDMYPSDIPEESEERRIADQVKRADLRSIAAKADDSKFVVKKGRQAPERTTQRIQYDAEKTDIERIRKHMGKPHWSLERIGRHTFDHFVRTECPE